MNTSSPAVHETGFNIGFRRISRVYLEAHRDQGSLLRFQAVGLVVIDEDVSAQLAAATIDSVKVYGMLIASPMVNVALHDRIKVIGISTYHAAQTKTR